MSLSIDCNACGVSAKMTALSAKSNKYIYIPKNVIYEK
jgi:hypothetical protein